MSPAQVPTSPPVPSTSTVPLSKQGGFNDPPSDIFKAKSAAKRPSNPPMPVPPFPQQPGYPGSPAPPGGMMQPGGPPQQPPMGSGGGSQNNLMAPGQPQMGMMPGYGYPTQQQISPLSPPAEPEKKRHPTGDRSHISAEHHPIYDTLYRCLNGCKPNANVRANLHVYIFLSLTNFILFSRRKRSSWMTRRSV